MEANNGCPYLDQRLHLLGKITEKKKRDHWFDPLVVPGQLEAPHPLRCPWTVDSPCFLHSRGCSRDTALR